MHIPLTKSEKGSARKRCRQRYKNRCAVCGRAENLTVHHIVPVSSGGTWVQANLILLCDWSPSGCHKLVHGWGSEQHLTPEQKRQIALLRNICEG